MEDCSKFFSKFRPAVHIPMIIGGVILMAGLAFLFGFIVMLLWNWLMPEIFDLGKITYWQGWGLVILAHILFKSFPGSHESSSGKKKFKVEFKKEFKKEFMEEFEKEFKEEMKTSMETEPDEDESEEGKMKEDSPGDDEESTSGEEKNDTYGWAMREELTGTGSGSDTGGGYLEK
jgi:hypothetical protein